MSRKTLLQLALVASFSLACAGRKASASPSSGDVALEVSGSERGRASYYADSLTGNKTANGERYNPALLTAAHRTLPFGTIVDVTRSDGRTVRVRINDRGPFAGQGRIIDLSRRAAEEIGLLREGVAPVIVHIVERPTRKSKRR